MSSDPITEGLKAQLGALGTGGEFVTIEWLDEWMAKTGALLQDRLATRQTIQSHYGSYRRTPIPYELAEFRQAARRLILQVIADREAAVHFLPPTNNPEPGPVAATGVQREIAWPERVTFTWVRNHVPFSWMWSAGAAVVLVFATGVKVGAWAAGRGFL